VSLPSSLFWADLLPCEEWCLDSGRVDFVACLPSELSDDIL